MKIGFLGFEITLGKKNDLSALGAAAKVEQTQEKLVNGYQEILEKNYKYSEYRLAKTSGVSINTVKKYRDYIELIKAHFEAQDKANASS